MNTLSIGGSSFSHDGKSILYSPQSFSVDSKGFYYLTDDGSEFTYLERWNISSGSSEKVEEAPRDISFASFSRNGKYRVIGINNDAKTEIKLYEQATDKLISLPG